LFSLFLSRAFLSVVVMRSVPVLASLSGFLLTSDQARRACPNDRPPSSPRPHAQVSPCDRQLPTISFYGLLLAVSRTLAPNCCLLTQPFFSPAFRYPARTAFFFFFCGVFFFFFFLFLSPARLFSRLIKCQIFLPSCKAGCVGRTYRRRGAGSLVCLMKAGTSPTFSVIRWRTFIFLPSAQPPAPSAHVILDCPDLFTPSSLWLPSRITPRGAPGQGYFFE